MKSYASAGRFTLISDALDLPKPFGPYTLLRRLAVGGMAEVYVAKTQGIGGFEKLIAIKVIHPRFSEDDHFVQMLVEEAKISVQLNHVNIAQTFDLGCIEDTYFIAMEFVEGPDFYRVLLRSKDRKLALPIDICCYVVAEACNGLGYAHRKRDPEGKPMGIVHRDISPQNVMTTFAGEVKIVDFGIAKAAMRSAQTEVGVIKGKYYYMSPEQAWGDPVDQRSDIFSTGILLYELLTGEMVYQENNIPALLDRVRKAEIESPCKKRPDVPDAVVQILMKAIAKEPSDRYQSADAFGQDLMEQLYEINPKFTASRLAALMGTLFPDDVKQRHSEILELPTEEVEAARKRAAPKVQVPNEEHDLAPMAPDEFIPQGGSVVFDLADLDDGDDVTRNEILPFQRMLARQMAADQRPTKEISSPASVPEPPTDERSVDRTDRSEETSMRERFDWDESTLIDGDGEAFVAVHQQIAAMRAAAPPADDDPDDLEGEKTVASTNPLALLAIAVAKKKPVPFPAPKRFGKPPGAKPPSMPPPARLPPKGAIPPPRKVPRAPEAPVPWPTEPPTLDERVPEVLPGDATGPSDLPEELVGEVTTAFVEESPPPPEAAAIAGAATGRVRLGPVADRFFPQFPTEPQPPPTQPGPFDPFGGAAGPGPGSGQVPLADPFTAPEAPGGASAASAQLGTPQPKRWILPAIGAALIVVAASVAGAIIAARPDPTSLEVISVPEGATVRIDGRTLAEHTPVTLTDRREGELVKVFLTHPGYEDTSSDFTLEEGENRRVYLLNRIRITLRVESRPRGAQVWIDGVLRGSAPLDISGLEIGQDLRLRGTIQGRQVELSFRVGEERRQTVTIEVPME